MASNEINRCADVCPDGMGKQNSNLCENCPEGKGSTTSG